MKVLVLGGAGFIGRHVAAALVERGHDVTIGTRAPWRTRRPLPAAIASCERREIHFERLTARAAWHAVLAGHEAVVNAVGILRPHGKATYDYVHHLAPAALAAACRFSGRRLVHISALGLSEHARSGFLTSKLAGERAVTTSGAPYSIVRPSLLDGEGGFGTRWLCWFARWPVHLIPADACGRIAVLHVKDLAEAIAILCEKPARAQWQEVEVGGRVALTMAEYLATLRARHTARRAVRISVPGWLARIVSHLCDVAHFSPFSFGHLELLRRDNVPSVNLLPELLGRAPLPLGVLWRSEVGHAAPVPLRRPALKRGRWLGTPTA